MAESRINTLKLITRIKQYLGWFIAIIFPFAARSILLYTKIPMASALIYWLICGILLRYILEKRLPYFMPKINLVKKELVIMIILTIISGCIYGAGITPINATFRDLLVNVILFALLNGALEQLVWINIYDLAGCRVKMAGFLAAFLSGWLIHLLYWSSFVPLPTIVLGGFIISHSAIFIVGISIYKKTRDITIWSIQHILYSILIVFLGGFGINMFIHI